MIPNISNGIGTTDNRNRTVQEIRNILTHHNGSLGEPGSAAYVFGSNPENPSFQTPVDNPTAKKQLLNLISPLEENEDVEKVYHNLP